MAKEYRQNAHYNEILSDGEGEQEQPKTNAFATRLPFGLCKRYGIPIQDDWRPRDAWNALKGKGITPSQVWADIKAQGATPNGQGQTSAPQTEGTPQAEQAINSMLSDSRVVYNSRWTRDRMEACINAGEPEMRDLTVSLFNDDSFGYNCNDRDTAFYPAFNKVCIIDKDDGGDDYYQAKGAAFYHETWHGIDCNYGSYRTNGEYLSTGFVLSTGKTFLDTLRAETRHVDWKGIKVSIDNEIREYYKKQGYDVDGIEAEWKRVNNELERIGNEAYARTGIFQDKWTARSKYLLSEEYLKAQKAINDLKNIPNSIKHKYGDLSDFYSGATGGRSDLVHIGHSTTYWRRGKVASRAHEAFANTASARATCPESYEVLKRYYPQTVAAFEEIYQKLKRGEIKNGGRPKYQK